MRARVVITGVGVVSALGRGFSAFARNILAGACGQRPLSVFDARTFGAPIAAEAELLEEEVLSAAEETGLDTEALRIDRKLIFGREAARQALKNAFGETAPPGMGLALGMGLEVLFLPDVVRLYDRKARDLDAGRLPLAGRRNPLRLDLGLIARAIADAAGVTGRVETFVSACASGTQCVGEAFGWIARGEASCVLAGATDSMLNPMGLGCFRLLGALSPRLSQDACRPFHVHRDGTVIGEGAAFFVLEELSFARSRGARILAEVLGFSTTLDAFRVTAPHPAGEGARRAMRRAYEAAGRPRLGYVNAHGTGTVQNDPAEIAAIRAELGDVPVGASKSQLGHAMASAGSLELAATLLCFTHGLCAPTLHLSAVAPDCQADHVREARPFTGDAALKNSFGFGGQNACLVLGGPP